MWSTYIGIVFAFAGLLFIGAAVALYWAHKNGQLRNFEEGSRSIFDEDEPEGTHTDAFPKKKPRGPKS